MPDTTCRIRLQRPWSVLAIGESEHELLSQRRKLIGLLTEVGITFHITSSSFVAAIVQ